MVATDSTGIAGKELDIKHEQKLWSLSSRRLGICLLLCAARATICLTRGSMSVAMMCITQNANSSLMTFSNETPGDKADQCNRRYQVQWSAEEQARVHTSYYIGATVGTLVTHYLIQTFGSKIVIVGSLSLQVLGSLLTPLEIIFLKNYFLLAVIRFVMGFSEGATVPAANHCIAHWFPANEKSTATAIFTIGNQIGVALSMSVTAKLSVYDILGGWPSAIFLYGCLSIVTLILWSIWGSSRAVDSRCIKQEELLHITGLENASKSKIQTKTPWKRLAASPCIIAIWSNAFVHSFVGFGLTTYLPKFYKETMNMDLTHTGLWSALPFLVQLAGKLGFGIWADKLKQSGHHVTFVVRMFNGIGSFGCALFLCLAAFLTAYSPTLSSISISSSIGLFGAHVAGYFTSIISVSPANTSAVSASQNLFSQGAGVCAQYVIGIFTSTNSLSEWTIVYVCMAIALVVTGLQFQFYGHGEAEQWNLVKENSSIYDTNTESSNENPS